MLACSCFCGVRFSGEPGDPCPECKEPLPDLAVVDWDQVLREWDADVR